MGTKINNDGLDFLLDFINEGIGSKSIEKILKADTNVAVATVYTAVLALITRVIMLEGKIDELENK